MKINKKVHENLINNLTNKMEDLITLIRDDLIVIEKAKSVEEIMRGKQQLMLELTIGLPVSTRDCYFCLLHEMKCHKCEYGKMHGSCTRDEISDWGKLEISKQYLEKNIYNYYKGETYSNAKRITIVCKECKEKYRRIEKDGACGFCKCGEKLWIRKKN